MKIQTRNFDATDDEVFDEVYRIICTLILPEFNKAPLFSKIKTELKCSEVDLLGFLSKHSKEFKVIDQIKNKRTPQMVFITSEGEMKAKSRAKLKK
jgi:hypothetical protein